MDDTDDWWFNIDDDIDNLFRLFWGMSMETVFPQDGAEGEVEFVKIRRRWLWSASDDLRLPSSSMSSSPSTSGPSSMDVTSRHCTEAPSFMLHSNNRKYSSILKAWKLSWSNYGHKSRGPLLNRIWKNDLFSINDVFIPFILNKRMYSPNNTQKCRWS